MGVDWSDPVQATDQYRPLLRTECTSVAGHSSEHNITQHGMLPQYPNGTAKLM